MSEQSVSHYVVRIERGGPWDWSRGMRRQAGWEEHARFMDALAAEGFIVLGGPLDPQGGEGGRFVLHVVAAPSERVVRERLAEDPWSRNHMLTITSIERWTILLDGRR